ncbi:MAG: hypothetical protein WD045_16455 [Pirellulaceae bacterium]
MDVEDWIKIIAVLIFFVGPLILRAFGGRDVQPDRRPPVELPDPPPRPQGGQRPPDGQPRSLEDEISEFLRETKRQGGEAPARERNDTFHDDEDFVTAEPVRPSYSDRRSSPSYTEAEPAQAALAQALEFKSAHDNPYAEVDVASLSSEPLTYEGLGDEYDYTSVDVEPDDPHAEKVAAAVTGVTLVEMIRDPNSLRSAFILGEVFRRPNR